MIYRTLYLVSIRICRTLVLAKNGVSSHVRHAMSPCATLVNVKTFVYVKVITRWQNYATLFARKYSMVRITILTSSRCG